MEKLLSILRTMPEYSALLDSVIVGESVAVTGIGQINRTHLIAGLRLHTTRPIVVICQDDIAAKRLQDELNAFLGKAAPVLPGRDLTLYDSAVVSRGWEQKRLRQLFDLATGATDLQIMSWNAMSQRTIPITVLKKAAFKLEIGKEYEISDLLDRLTGCGYSRSTMVEGPGQFAVRGGILDVFSPAADRPVRAEFFGDELDTMGYFDPDSQRRTENVDSIVVLPVGETQPKLHQAGIDGLCEDLRSLIARQKRRKTPNDVLIKTLERDLEKYENGLQNPASDRYMSLIYPDNANALSYLPANSIIVLCDQNNLHRAARTRIEEIGMQLDSLLQAGLVAGELCDFVYQWEDVCSQLQEHCVVYLDSFAGTSYPEENPPKQLLPMNAKQLPGYGGSLDTAVSDLHHYQKAEFSSLVLCGSRRRAELLQEMLHSKGLSAMLCIPLTTMPKPGQILLAEGTLPFGMEYPNAKLAILTEGQLITKTEPRRKAKKAATNRRGKLRRRFPHHERQPRHDQEKVL